MFTIFFENKKDLDVMPWVVLVSFIEKGVFRKIREISG
jgi:hypothetical protein